MISVKNIGKHSGKTTTSKVNSGGFVNTSINIVANEIKGVNMWGQYHDHTSDVDGDMMVNGNITTSANIMVDGDINCGELIATEIGADSVTANRVEAITSKADNLYVNNNATVQGTLNSSNITAQYLTVTKQAHFFNLTIDEIKSVGGQIILSAANATIDHVEQVGGQYQLCWKKNDGEKGVENKFRRNDQVICQTFNVTDLDGEVENKYYWGVVTTVGDDEYTIDGETVECHYIALSPIDFDGSSIPEAGDRICQLGYRGTDDPQRQSAIILSAYKSPDPNVTAPSIVQYEGINTFSLDGCITNQLAHGENVFTGNFKVINNGSTTDVVDLIQGQHPQVITNSEQSWMMSDSDGKTYVSTDYQNLPTTIQVYLGSTLIPYSEWTTGSQVKFKNKTYRLTGTQPFISEISGIHISSITRNTNDCTLVWNYKGDTSSVYDPTTGTTVTVNNGTAETNQTLEITIVFTHNGTTYTVSKNVPFNLIKASAVTQGADAEFDRLMIDKLDLTVTLDNNLTCKVNAKVYHIKGNSIEQETDLTDYTANILLSNGTTVSLSKSSYFYRTNNISNSYSSMSNPPTSATLRLYRKGTLVDEVATSIKFDAGSIFTITDNAITSAVQQAQTYTDGQITNVNSSISQVQQTADSISSRVTNIENDYVTSSELTQTADNIQLNVYDELKNKTGIDVSAGQITLNGNTVVNGNLTLTEAEQGFTLVGDGGYAQILPKSIGTYDEFTSQTTTTMPKQTKANGVETGTDQSQGRIVFTFTSEFNIGTIKSGSTITVAPVSRNYFNVLVNGISNINQYTRETTKTIEFIEDDVVKSTQTWDSGNQVVYTTQGENLTIRITVTAGIYETTFVYSREPWQVIDINVTLPIEEAFTLIGNDGIGMTFGSRKNIYMGADGATFRYGQYGLRINATNGIEIFTGTYWYTLDEYIQMMTPHP